MSAVPDDQQAEPGPLGTLEGREFAAKMLALLPTDQRQVLVLRVYGDLRAQEIADQLSMPVGTVESRLVRAKQRLRSVSGGSRTRPSSKRVPNSTPSLSRAGERTGRDLCRSPDGTPQRQEHSDAGDDEQHAGGEPWPGAPLADTLLPGPGCSADLAGSTAVEIGDVKRHQAATRQQPCARDIEGTPPYQHCNPGRGDH
jgi:hypothetical protein